MCTGNCNCSCDNISIPSIEGPQGPAGLNAFTVTTLSFIVPNIGSNVFVQVSNSNPLTGSWAAIGQIIYIEDAGYYRVVGNGATVLNVTNLGYTGNTAPGTNITSGKKVSPSGIKGSNSTLKFDRFNATAPTGSWTLFSPSAYQELNYTDYSLSQNNDRININAQITCITTLAESAEIRINFNGITLFTLTSSFIPTGNNLIVFDFNITRLTSTSAMIDGIVSVANGVFVQTTKNYVISSLSATVVPDLDNSGNYPIQIDLETNTTGTCILSTQTITSIKAI